MRNRTIGQGIYQSAIINAGNKEEAYAETASANAVKKTHAFRNLV